jgi:ribosomal protein L11 methyltransferase
MPQPVPEAFLEVRIVVPADLVEAACDFIIENIAGGLVLEDEDGSPTTTIIFYVPDSHPDFQARLTQFLTTQTKAEPCSLPELQIRRVTETEWLEQYRDSIRMIRIADDVIVRPVWIPPTSDRYQVVLEPKMAFGTGSHATTRSCLRIIRQKFQPGWRFLDMGCGSGVLSILADQMGATYIKAIDYDLAAVANCRENFELNRVVTPNEILIGSIEKCARDEVYQLVAANIIRTTILTMLDRLLKLTAPGGFLVLSGLLERDEIVLDNALRNLGQLDFTTMRDEGWLTYTINRK